MLQLKDGQLRISVRQLVEFLRRQGDLDQSVSGGVRRLAMLEGTRIHRKLQKSAKGLYTAEVPLSLVSRIEDFTVAVEGRADGIIRETAPTKADGKAEAGKEGAGKEDTGETTDAEQNGPALSSADLVTVDEIKGMYLDVTRLEEPVPVHLSQALCYAHFLCCREHLPGVQVQMTYCDLDNEDRVKRFRLSYTADELAGWYQALLDDLLPWLRFLKNSREQFLGTARRLEFPFPYRAGQRGLAAAVYHTHERAGRLFIQAPTGIGKTMSVIFPSIRAMGGGTGGRLFYLTARTTTAKAAEEALRLLAQKGLMIHRITLSAKERLCVLDEPDCRPEACPRARGYMDRINAALLDMITHEEAVDSEILRRYGEKYQVCPYYLSLEAADFSQAILCDYNYVFDPDVRLERYFGDGNGGEYLLLVDEAHNLPDRAREMYSASLAKEEILSARRALGIKKGRLYRQMESVNRIMLDMKRGLSASIERVDDLSVLCGELDDLYGLILRKLEEEDFSGRDELLSLSFSIRRFLSVYDIADEHYRFFAVMNEDGSFAVRLLCMNPIRNINACLAQVRSAVLFSATLLPLRYYRELISTDPEDAAVYAPSPFDPDNRLILQATDVTSRYRDRSAAMYARIASYIKIMAKTKTGNYMVFFPSYSFMMETAAYLLPPEKIAALRDEDVEKIGRRRSDYLSGDGKAEAEDIQTSGGCVYLLQKQRMSAEDREAFLAAFVSDLPGPERKSLVGLCVMGGIFAEGIDLQGDRLVGVCVVGTGMPSVSGEQRELQKYFDETLGRGFDFTYRYPGMTRVLQAAGRLIRTARDRGVILLLDDRFGTRAYRELYPREWEEIRPVTLQTAEAELQAFWKERGIV